VVWGSAERECEAVVVLDACARRRAPLRRFVRWWMWKRGLSRSRGTRVGNDIDIEACHDRIQGKVSLRIKRWERMTFGEMWSLGSPKDGVELLYV